MQGIGLHLDASVPSCQRSHSRRPCALVPVTPLSHWPRFQRDQYRTCQHQRQGLVANRSTAIATASRPKASTKRFGCLGVWELVYAPMGIREGREVLVLADPLYCRPQAIAPQMPPIASDAISSRQPSRVAITPTVLDHLAA